jgi:hypothetical protein
LTTYSIFRALFLHSQLLPFFCPLSAPFPLNALYKLPLPCDHARDLYKDKNSGTQELTRFRVAHPSVFFGGFSSEIGFFSENLQSNHIRSLPRATTAPLYSEFMKFRKLLNVALLRCDYLSIPNVFTQRLALEIQSSRARLFITTSAATAKPRGTLE